jgi:hypothetical protein
MIHFLGGTKMAGTQGGQGIPTNLDLRQFEEFVLPHLSVGSRGPAPKLSLHKIFNFILQILYLGCQWKELPIESDSEGCPEILTREFIVSGGAGKPMAVSIRFFPARS